MKDRGLTIYAYQKKRPRPLVHVDFGEMCGKMRVIQTEDPDMFEVEVAQDCFRDALGNHIWKRDEKTNSSLDGMMALHIYKTKHRKP